MSKAPPLTRTPYSMAYGRPGAARANAGRPNVNIDEYLLAEARNPRAPRLQRAVAKPPVQLAAPAPAQDVLESVDTSINTESVQLAAAVPPAPQGFERYSERAQTSRDLLQFRGGDAIVITASTLVVILLIVLLLILLT